MYGTNRTDTQLYKFLAELKPGRPCSSGYVPHKAVLLFEKKMGRQDMPIVHMILIALTGVSIFTLLRLRLYRFRGIRITLILILGWGYFEWIAHQKLVVIEPQFEHLFYTHPNFLVGYYYSIYVIVISFSFVVLWLLDKNVFGLLMYRLEGVFQSSKRITQKESQEERELKEIKGLIKKRARIPKLKAFKPAPQHEGLNLILGEIADMETGLSSLDHFYIPEGGIYTNTLAFGSIGSAKTAGFLYPVVRQMIAYSPQDREEQIAGLVFDLKGDFANQVHKYLKQYQRADDFIELTLDGDYIFNLVSDPAMSPQVLASMLQSLVEQVLGREKQAFWKGQNMSLIENMTSGWKCAFDYVNLLWFNVFTLNPDNGQTLIEYIQGITGGGYANEGTTLVYRNIMPNTELPWVYRDSETGERVRQHVQVTGDDSSMAKRTDGIKNFMGEVKGAYPENMDYELFRSAYRFMYQQEKGLKQTSPDEGAFKEELLLELKPYYEEWKRIYLNPEAPDKAHLLQLVLDVFGVDHPEMELKNPFSGRMDAFSHDFCRYHVDRIHFYKIKTSPLLKALLGDLKMLSLEVDEDRCMLAEVFATWYQDTWMPFGSEMHAKIFGLIGSIVNFFKDPNVQRTFGSSLVTYYDHLYNPKRNLRKVFPNFDWLMTEGKWLCVTIPKARYHMLTDILCNLIKQQFQCVALQRTDLRKRAKYPQYNYDRKVCLLIDEYHLFATSGNTLDCDNNFLSVNRQCKVFFIGATQSIENLKNKFGSDAPVKQILSCVRNKIWLGLEDPDSAKYASELIGEGSVYRVSKSMGENQSDSPYSVFAGDYQGESAGVSQSVSYQQTIDKIVLAKKFLELRSFQAIAVCYDGDQRMISKIYLKPYWREPHEAFHWQVEQGILKETKRL